MQLLAVERVALPAANARREQSSTLPPERRRAEVTGPLAVEVVDFARSCAIGLENVVGLVAVLVAVWRRHAEG